MNQNLVVTYPDGREDVYPIAEGQSTLGSDAGCEFGIQASGVEPRHIVFALDSDAIHVVNLCDSSTAKLNGAPLDGRRPFEIGDELEVGTVKVRLRQMATDGEDLASSSAGTVEVADSVRRDDRSGWRGYRKILEKVAPFISPEEAEAAESQHTTGYRMLLRCIGAVVVLYGLSWYSEARQWFVTQEATSCVAAYVELVSILFLTARYRLRFAGRVFFLMEAAILGCSAPTETWPAYFNYFNYGAPAVILFFLFLGWLYDIGAGCVFAAKRRTFLGRYLLLLLSVGILCGLVVLIAILEPTLPGVALRYCPLLGVAATYPLWSRWVRRRHTEELMDISFVAELAFHRMGRRWVARTIAVLAVGTPLLYLLCSLGLGERIVWEENDNLFITKENSGEHFAWYWYDRGRYLEKSDFDTALIYQVPYMELLAIESNAVAVATEAENSSDTDDADTDLDEKVIEIQEMVWEPSERFLFKTILERRGIDPEDEEALSAFLESDEGKTEVEQLGVPSFSPLGLDLWRKIAHVQTEATNALAFAELKEALAPYRITTAEAETFAERLKGFHSAQAFYLEEVPVRETYASGLNPRLFHAQVDVGMAPFSLEGSQRYVASIGALVVPGLVCLILGCLFLWKRGADSSVGFWLGIGMTMNVVSLFDGLGGSEILDKTFQYPLWHLAVESPIWGLVAGWFGLAKAGSFLLKKLALLAQSVLFVLLCWPRKPMTRGGRLRRSFAFLGKALVGFGIGVLPVLAVAFVEGFIHGVSAASGAERDIGSSFFPRAAAIVSLGLVGAWLRRKRRFNTEAPELGWMFFFGWMLLEMAISVPVAALGGEEPLVPQTWLNSPPWWPTGPSVAGLVSGTASVIGGILFLWLLLKKNFLAVMTISGFTFALFAFSVPFISEFCNNLVADLLHGSFLRSDRGESIVSLGVIVLIMGPLWNALERLSKRLSVRNLARVESEVNTTLETVLDQTGNVDMRDEVFSRLSELGLRSYAFYFRSATDSFDLLLTKEWNGQTADSVPMSKYLRHWLGDNPQVVDIEHLEQEEPLFFQSFELFRIGRRLHASCLLPICLGTSVRAILVTPEAANTNSLPNNAAFIDIVNTLGLAATASMTRTRPESLSNTSRMNTP